MTPALPRPVLGLFGSDQAVTAGQLAACDPHWTRLRGTPGDDAGLGSRMAVHGIALASLHLPDRTSRAEAARRIAAALGAIARQVPRPGTLAVAGGETLRALLSGLGARSLLVEGRAVPGVPISRIVGGTWDGVTVLSKSGAFGHPDLLRELLGLPERIHA